MTDESKLARDAERGRIARDILQSDVFTDAVGKVEAELIEAWKATPALAPEARERLWVAVSLINKIVQAIAETMAHGEVAETQLRAIRGQDPGPVTRLVRRL